MMTLLLVYWVVVKYPSKLTEARQNAELAPATALAIQQASIIHRPTKPIAIVVVVVEESVLVCCEPLGRAVDMLVSNLGEWSIVLRATNRREGGVS